MLDAYEVIAGPRGLGVDPLEGIVILDDDDRQFVKIETVGSR